MYFSSKFLDIFFFSRKVVGFFFFYCEEMPMFTFFVSTQSQIFKNFRGLRILILEDYFRFIIGRVLYKVSIVRFAGEKI